MVQNNIVFNGGDLCRQKAGFPLINGPAWNQLGSVAKAQHRVDL